MRPKKPTKKQCMGKSILAWALCGPTGIRQLMHPTRSEAMDYRRSDETVVRVLVTIVDDKTKDKAVQP